MEKMVTKVMFNISEKGDDETTIKEIRKRIVNELYRLSGFRRLDSILIKFLQTTFEKRFEFAVTVIFDGELNYTADVIKDQIIMSCLGVGIKSDFHITKELKIIEESRIWSFRPIRSILHIEN